jgi:tartrate-resistant acid phosphatase type 5
MKFVFVLLIGSVVHQGCYNRIPLTDKPLRDGEAKDRKAKNGESTRRNDEKSLRKRESESDALLESGHESATGTDPGANQDGSATAQLIEKPFEKLPIRVDGRKEVSVQIADDKIRDKRIEAHMTAGTITSLANATDTPTAQPTSTTAIATTVVAATVAPPTSAVATTSASSSTVPASTTGPLVSTADATTLAPTTTATVVAPLGGDLYVNEFVAFGDWGENTTLMRTTMGVFNTKFPNIQNVFLLGDNFYTAASARSFDIFTQYVAPAGTNRTHYTVLGNHDYDDDQRAQNEMDYANRDPRWVLPAPGYYFRRFYSGGGGGGGGGRIDVCVWFLDTQKLLGGPEAVAQYAWLRQSLNREESSCQWKLMTGHHPVIHASPFQESTRRGLRQLVNIMRQNHIHMYMCGHHHNTQFLRDTNTGVYHAIVGSVMQIRGTPNANAYAGDWPTREYLFGHSATTAIMKVSINEENLRVEFHSGRDANDPILYTYTINRN